MKINSILLGIIAMGFSMTTVAETIHTGGDVIVISENISENDPETILATYIKAVGGMDNISKIKNSVMEMQADFQGTSILIKGISDQEGKRMVQETSVGGNVVQKTILINGKGSMSIMGQDQDLPEEMVQMLKAQIYVFPEEHYEELGYGLELQGTEDIDGEEAHKLIISAPNGMKTVEYYAVDSGLKIRTSSDATGDISYGDYQLIEGVKVPMSLTISNPMMPVALEAKVIVMKFNQPLTDQDFK
jgi:phosphotransferase system IIB component